MTLVQSISGYVSDLSVEGIPARVLDRARDRMLDALSTSVASRDIDTTQAIIATVDASDGTGGACTVIPTGVRASAQDAALINGTAIHAVLFEDYYVPSADHPGASVVAAALAAAESAGQVRGRPSTIGDVLTAIVAGYEVQVKLGDIAAAGIRARGLRTMGVLGTVGAAAAAAKAFGLTAERTAAAIGMGANLAHGFLEGFAHGTMEPYIQAGTAARNGVLAAVMGHAGVQAAPLSLEGPTGYLAALAGMAPADQEFPTDEWGILKISVKPYPVSGGKTSTVGSALDLVAQGVRGEDVDHVVVRLPTRVAVFPGSDFKGPFGGMKEVQDSTQFVVAAALLGRPMKSLKTVAEDYADADIAELCQRIEVVGEDGRFVDGRIVAQVDVTMRDGRTLTAQVDNSDANVASIESMSEKLRLLAQGFWRESQTERVIDLIAGDPSTPIEALSAALLNEN